MKRGKRVSEKRDRRKTGREGGGRRRQESKRKREREERMRCRKGREGKRRERKKGKKKERKRERRECEVRGSGRTPNPIFGLALFKVTKMSLITS